LLNPVRIRFFNNSQPIPPQPTTRIFEPKITSSGTPLENNKEDISKKFVRVFSLKKEKMNNTIEKLKYT
jgi:hypothetical protein